MVPGDILAKLEADFTDADELELAVMVITELADDAPAQTLRCVVHLGEGDYGKLEEAEKFARLDGRALILSAEYDEKGQKKLHDFKKKFRRELSDDDKEKGVLREAMKVFRKRLRLYQLDDESRIGHNLSKGELSGITAIEAPDAFPQEIWDKLVKLGELREVEGSYELVE
jgi:hypothetical protein